MTDTYKPPRNSHLLMNEVYFWTNTILNWNTLLEPDKYKLLILTILRDLVEKDQIRIYGFVIMPNHMHVIWEMVQMNGKEMPHASFNKATAHLIVKDLKLHHPKLLPTYKVISRERSYRIWQRDPLAVLMDSREKVEQKLDYIHNNPLQERWNLTKSPEAYQWSSAAFYDLNNGIFDFLTHYQDRF